MNTVRHTFSKNERLHTNKDFKIVFRKGKLYYAPSLHMYLYKRVQTNANPNITRLGIVVSRKLDTAVKRNKLKRRIREIFRLSKYRLKKGYDIIFVAKNNSTKLNYNQLKETIFDHFTKANLFL